MIIQPMFGEGTAGTSQFPQPKSEGSKSKFTSAETTNVSVRSKYNVAFLPVTVTSALIRYCELKDMGLPTADVFRRIKENYGDTLITFSPGYTFNQMQQHFEKTRLTPYKDLIDLLNHIS